MEIVRQSEDGGEPEGGTCPTRRSWSTPDPQLTAVPWLEPARTDARHPQRPSPPCFAMWPRPI